MILKGSTIIKRVLFKGKGFIRFVLPSCFTCIISSTLLSFDWCWICLHIFEYISEIYWDQRSQDQVCRNLCPCNILQLGCESVFGELGSLGIPSGLSYVISYHWSYTSQQKEDSALGHFLNPQPKQPQTVDRMIWAHQQKKGIYRQV